MIHLITFGDHKYSQAKKRLYQEAIDSGWFDSVSVYGPEDLDTNYKNMFKEILKFKRGAGYWIWKPYIIKKKLKEINDNDILIYLDAGCSINLLGKSRLDEYIEILNNSNEGIISFYLHNLFERQYTTKQIFQHFNIKLDSEISTSEQLVGGIRIMKKNENLLKLINLEYQVYEENPLLITDYYNGDQQESYFIDNRHEQSIFSIIRKLSHPILIKDETCFEYFGCEESLQYPFWATRYKNKK